MKTLQKIIAGATIIGASMFGYNANAQNALVPTKVSTETSLVGSKDNAGILMQRVETGNDAWTFKYDYNPKLNFETKPVNVGLFSLNKLYNKNNLNIGIEGFQVGNFDGKDTWFVDAWISKKFKNSSIMIDPGLGFPSNNYTQVYAIATFKHPKTSLCGAFYKVSPEETRYYGYAAYHDHNVYATAGNKINTEFVSAGIYGLENFGNLTFATLDRKTGDVWIKSQTAVGNVNDKFYSIENFDLASDILSMPMFQPIHLGPLSTKGNLDLKLEYKSRQVPSNVQANHDKVSEMEIMLGTNKTPFVQLGVGLNTEYACGKSISNVAIELYKDVKFGKFTGSAEARYNARTSTATGYVKMSYTF